MKTYILNIGVAYLTADLSDNLTEAQAYAELVTRKDDIANGDMYFDSEDLRQALLSKKEDNPKLEIIVFKKEPFTF